MIKAEPLEHVSLSDEESTDAKKELDDIDITFDEARVAKSVTGRGLSYLSYLDSWSE